MAAWRLESEPCETTRERLVLAESIPNVPSGDSDVGSRCCLEMENNCPICGSCRQRSRRRVWGSPILVRTRLPHVHRNRHLRGGSGEESPNAAGLALHSF